MNDVIKTVESLEKSGLLVDGVTETVKHEIKKQEVWFLGTMMATMAGSLIAPMAFSLMQPVVSSLTNAISGKGVTTAGNGQEGGFLPLLTLPLTMKVLRKGVTRAGKGVRRAGKRCNNMDHMDKNI